jgi:hypothetical protein
MTRALIAVVFVCCFTLPAVCQSTRKYQVGTITAVERSRDGGNASSEPTSYDVSVQVNGTVYVVRYKDPLGSNIIEYAAGRDLLVFVGDKTITYNDMLGRSWDVPILSRKPAPTSTSRSK